MDAKSIVEDLVKQKQKRQEVQAVAVEEIEQYKESINRLFQSPDGKFFMKKLVKYCGVYAVDNTTNGMTLVENNGKRKVYLELIRPYLTKTTLMELEQ